MLDLIGKVFGRLTIISEVGRDKNGSVTWLCSCECGNQVVRSAARLMNGTVRSCNCLRGSKNAMPFGVAAFNSLFSRYKEKAKIRNLIFELTETEFRTLTSKPCAYCKSEPIKQYRVNKRVGYYTYNGIDRIDSKIGYVIDNCVSCCYRCNVMKSDMNAREFLEHIKRIYECQNMI